MAVDLVLKGFKSKSEVDAFLTWFSNSGEQELGTDLECRREEGKTELPTFISIDWGSKHEESVDGGGNFTISQQLKFHYAEEEI